MTIRRPKDAPAATAVAAGDTFLIDGATGVRALAATAVPSVLPGKVVTVNNSLTLAGTDGTTMTFPTTSASVARTDAGQTFTGTQAFGALTATTLNGAALDNLAWTAYTPSSAFATPGTSVMATAAGRWKQIGKTVHFSVDATVTTVGTGTGSWVIGLPTASSASNPIIGASGKEVITLGVLLAIQAVGSPATTCTVLKYDNTSLAAGGNGTRVQFNGTYEAA
ncbi:hypothetical protein SAMN05443247_07624 [Bradyrhizobium erythrophlei]|nr:hypothetical protein SAMN05443247_07624 [Bradyrhizobium erythrophlei]